MSGYHAPVRGGFIENTLEGLHSAMQQALRAEATAFGPGLLQRLDPRVKVAGFMALVVAAALTARLWPIVCILAASVLLAVLSTVPVRVIASRAWLGAAVFSGSIALPAIFLTPGTPVGHLPITLQGLRTAAFLVLRAEAAATLLLVLAFTTPWNHILKALRIFRVPLVLVVILGMTCRYILLLIDTAHQMFESRRSRIVNRMTAAEGRRLAITGSGVLLMKTLHLSGEVYLAMQSRGFRGEVQVLDDFRMRSRDWCASAAFAAVTVFFVYAGR